jgi:predicted Ser/Thr protein kinase
MGVVYLGRDEALDRDVAIKTLRVDGSQDDESRGRFEIEAKAAARLQHPNIVTVFELGEDRGLPYIAMELLAGQDLETLLRSGEKLSTTERLDVVIQTLRGLDFAHAHQIVHRDIKPSNLRVLDDGGVKILDFGIAKVESTSVTRAGMMVGTPYYMSPEHIRGGTLDGRTDVFAVGVILHELFAGKRPFMADDPTRVLYRIVNEPHPKLPIEAAGPVTPEIQAVIDKALEKDADLRFASAALMADELTRVRDRYPSPQLTPDEVAALSQARKSLAANKADASMLQTVESIARAKPDATEAQRLRRLFKRKPSDPQTMAETAAFPELDATFGKAEGGETLMEGKTVSGSAETILQGGGAAAPASAPPPPASKAVVYGAIAAVAIAGFLAVLLYANRGPSIASSARPTPTITEIFVPGTEATPEKPATAAAPPVRSVPAAVIPKAFIEITSQPPGAQVRLDKKAIGDTPLRAEVAGNAAHVITLSLDGYQSKDLRVDLPIPASLEATLSPSGPPATLVVESAYPVTVTVSGRVVASDKAGVTTSLSAGTQEVVIESPSVFLKHRETVQFAGGASVTIKTPMTGKIGVRATPDNCKIFVNGVFVDYPPILDRNIAAGNHVVSFEWPDGKKSEEKVQIQAGKQSFVMGRKP